MRRTSLLVVALALTLAGCDGPGDAVATATKTPTPSPPSMTLLAEKDLQTKTGTAYALDWTAGGMLTVASGVEVTLLAGDLSAVVATLEPSKGAVAAAWSPDQKSLATVYGLRNPTFTIWGWDGAGARLTTEQQVPADSDQFDVSWSPDGKLLATLASDRRSTIEIWDTGTWKLLHRFDLPYSNPQRVLAWSADGSTIYAAGELTGQVVYFGVNASDGSVQELGKLPAGSTVYALAFAPDLSRVAVATKDGQVQIIDIGAGTVVAQLKSVAEPADLAWSPNNYGLAVLGNDTTLQLWTVPAR